MSNNTVKISIEFPLKGEWQFLRPPGHHPFAFDFIKKDENRKKNHSKHIFNSIFTHIKCKDYYCWNQPIYSPVNGKVIKVGTGWKDHKSTNIWKTISIWYNATYRFKPKEIDGILDIRPNAGNYIMIKTNDNYIVFLAHLKQDSLMIKKGDLVNIGQHIGNVGNSGNSTAPHLHINLFDQMKAPLTAKVLPFVFKKYEELMDRKWVSKSMSVPKIKSFIRLN